MFGDSQSFPSEGLLALLIVGNGGISPPHQSYNFLRDLELTWD
jgi:hypothetical protein